MSEVFEGQCQCGAVQYRVQGTAATLFACHCQECQRQSSSAFGMALWVRGATVTLLRGHLKEWVRALPSGGHMACRFCPDCGTRLFHQVLGQNRILSIKPGTLNDASRLQPVGHIWTQRKHGWVALPDDVLQYPANPETFDALIAAWHTGNNPAPQS